VDRPGSDLDILAVFPPGFDLMEAEVELEDLPGIRVDVVSDDDRTSYALAAARADAVRL
jgi:predicted nucleotidyltransferase